MTGVASLQTLGGFRFSVDGRELVAPPTQKARALLAYLVWNPSTEFSRERIIELFWPECDPERGRSSLNTALWSIRRSLRDAGTDPAGFLAADKTKVAWTCGRRARRKRLSAPRATTRCASQTRGDRTLSRRVPRRPLRRLERRAARAVGCGVSSAARGVRRTARRRCKRAPSDRTRYVR